MVSQVLEEKKIQVKCQIEASTNHKNSTYDFNKSQNSILWCTAVRSRKRHLSFLKNSTVAHATP